MEVFAERFEANNSFHWSGGEEIPGLEARLIKPVLGSDETTKNALYLSRGYRAGEYHISIPEGYSMQRLGTNASGEETLVEVWSGPFDENLVFSPHGPLVVYKDGEPNPVGTFTLGSQK
jgi:hypothetical protein